MANSKFEVCSRSLIEIGISAISSFDDSTPASRICGVIWDDYAKYLLSIYPWRFTFRTAQLSRLNETPDNGWQYAFQMPSNLIGMRSVYTSLRSVPLKQYAIFEKKIYCDYQKIYIDYQAYVEPIDWPVWFLEFVVQALAAKLASSPLLNKQDIATNKYMIAFGPPQDNGKGGLFGQARFIDSKQMPSEALTSFDLMYSRFG